MVKVWRMALAFAQGALILAFPTASAAQESATQESAAVASKIVANQVAVSQRDATLSLELEDGSVLEIAFRDGAIEVDGAVVGSFVRDDALESSWRDLLGSAVGASHGPLAFLLAQWDSPVGLEDDQARAANLLDTKLDEFLGGQVVATALDEAASAIASANATAEALTTQMQLGTDVSELLRSHELLGLLSELGDLDLDLDELRVSIGEDLTVRRGERIEGDVLVLGGDLDVRGDIEGNVVVADGRVRLFDGGVIDGDLRLADATFSDYGGELTGRRSRIRADRTDEFDRMRDELRSEIRAEIRDELESELHGNYDWRPRGGVFNPFRHFWAGLMGLFQNVLTFGILAAVGAIMLYFNSERMAEVVTTARTSTGKSVVVGIAGSFLFFPVWILGVVVLAISIIGIPALLLWVPLLPLAAAFAALFGMFAVATVVGEWAQSRRFRFLEWADDPNAFYRMVSGLLVMTALFGGANVLRMGGPLLGFFHGLLAFIACLVATGVVLTGFGAVLLTWSQRRSVRFSEDSGQEWSWREWTRRPGKGSADARDADAEVVDTAVDPVDAGVDPVDAGVDPVDETLDDIKDTLDEPVDGARDSEDADPES